MTQQECLNTASHFTHLGVCYPGSNASLTLSDPNNPQPVNFTVVPEPSTNALMVLAMLMGALYTHRSRCRFRSD